MAIDIRGKEILQQDSVLLETLLTDHNRPNHGKRASCIFWAIGNYASLGTAYAKKAQMSI